MINISKVLFMVILVVSIGVGIAFGSRLGFDAGVSEAAKLSINTQVHALNNRVKAMEALRAGKKESAIQLMEAGLDANIITLAPNRREGIDIPEHTESFIRSGLKSAKAYREKFPRTYQSELVKMDVMAAFSSVP